MRRLLQVTWPLFKFKLLIRYRKEITLFLPICPLLLHKDTGLGRPKTSLISLLRVSFWSHAVLLASKLDHVQDLEAFLRKKHRLDLASGLWSRYMRGEVVPQGALVGAPNSLVNRIGKFFPNTLDAFYAPFWDLLVWEPSVNPIELKSIYLSLGDKVSVHFVMRVEHQFERVPAELGRFWHLKKTIANRRQLLQQIGEHWICLAICLLEARMSYAAQNIEGFVDCQLLASQLLAYSQVNPQFQIKRLRGVLLTMEALCLDALYINVVEPPPTNDMHQRLRDKANLAIKAWANRCRIHINSLSPNSKRAFVQRLKGGTRVGGFHYFSDL